MKIKWRAMTTVVSAAALFMLSGCAQVGYYMQAVEGQMSLLSEARPIDDWLADPGVEGKLKDRLAKVQEIRRFAAIELGLPDNDSYKTYADLKRSYVLWNVVAAPALSLKPMNWCFPIAGCVNYRGYYKKSEAQAFADELRMQGYDVQVSGVPAYSTLGYFNDPVLSTFIKYSDAELARLVFHELAHQVAYAKDDSRFNESFAVAVEEVGVERWMERFGDEGMKKRFSDYTARKRDFLDLLTKYRQQLLVNYAGGGSDAEKKARKTEIFQALKDEYKQVKADRWAGYPGYDRWFADPLSNAHLATISTYHDLVPKFRAMLKQERDLPRFYEAVRRLSSLDKQARHQSLARFGDGAATIATSDAAAGLTN
ncbi:aminopeptidase [Lacisediminimonas profundi]|uniref:aminopeptidase n=1 Tax=Lacisediminimonas profundi TaxID=2603856 RepID=UPI001F4FA045|nr:aminopeptidase [Lacisediminimonas profundi]